MRYAIAADHAGLPLKRPLSEALDRLGHEVTDLGTHSEERVDYPVYAEQVARAVTDGEADFGILVCGSGLGMSIAANRFPAVRAVTPADSYGAQMARRHNDANVLCLGARLLGIDAVLAMLEAWDAAGFEGGRHQGRVDMLGGLPRGQALAAAPGAGQAAGERLAETDHQGARGAR